MDIPSPPLWQNLLFEQPWPLAMVLLVIAVVLRMAGRSRGSRPLRWSAVAAVAIGAGVVGLAFAVDTGREAVRRLTLDLVDATAPLDAARVSQLLAEDVRVTGPGGGVVLAGDEVHARLKAIDDDFAIKAHRVRDVKAWAKGTEGLAGLALYTEVSVTPTLTRWRLEWEKTGGAWRVTEVRWLSLNGSTPQTSWLTR